MSTEFPTLAPLRPDLTVPITILRDDKSVCVVFLPTMTRTEFYFFMKQLEAFREAVVAPPGLDPLNEAKFSGVPTETPRPFNREQP